MFLMIAATFILTATPNTAQAGAAEKAQALCKKPSSEDCQTVCNAFNAGMMQPASVLSSCTGGSGGKVKRSGGGGGGRRKPATKKISAQEVDEIVDQKLSGKYVLDWDAEITPVIVLFFGILNAFVLFLFWRKLKENLKSSDMIKVIGKDTLKAQATANQALAESQRTRAALLHMAQVDPQLHQAVQQILNPPPGGNP